MNKMQKTACMTLLLAAISGLAHAESVDVKVTGTITPAGCSFDLPNGNIIDAGEINAQSLKADSLNWIADKRLDFAINCAVPTKLALTVSSGRGASAVNDDGTVSEAGSVTGGQYTDEKKGSFGLGMQGNKGIGGYAMLGREAKTDDFILPYGLIYSDGNTTNWIYFASMQPLIKPGVKRYFTWTKGTGIPTAFKHLTSALHFEVYINRASELDLSHQITLDGMATIEMVYL